MREGYTSGGQKDHMYEAQDRALLLGSEREPLPQAKLIRKAPDRETLTATLLLHPRREWPEPHMHAGSQSGTTDAVTEPALLLDRQGASETAIAKIHAFVREFGLTVVETDKKNRTVKVVGTVSQMEQAFHIDLHDYEHPDGNYRGRTGGIFLPTSLIEIVSEVFGLDNRPADTSLSRE